MFEHFPHEIEPLMQWGWDDFKPYAAELLARPLSADNVSAWLNDWSLVTTAITETASRRRIRTTTHTNDEAGQAHFQQYAEQVIPRLREFDQAMKEKLLASGLEPDGFAVPLRRMRAEAALFRAENLPLQTEIEKIAIERHKITGAWAVEWEGEQLPFMQAVSRLQNADRNTREQVWGKLTARVRLDREKLDNLWIKVLDLRLQMARNAGYDSYRDYRWQEMARFDYTPADCMAFHHAIEQIVVPAVSRLNARRRDQLGLESLRVWDNFWFSSPDPLGHAPLAPYQTVNQLNDTIEAVFRRVDPQLGAYYRLMRDENLLDLESRLHKAGGAYMEEFPFSRRSFIFGSAVGSHDSVVMLLHEGGHAFHGFEASRLPYHQQRMLEFMPVEFVEVGSMAMELLASPYLAADEGGFYSRPEAARARAEHLENILKFLPYMSVVDSFQHWVYENPDLAHNPHQCDAAWSALHRRYLPDFVWGEDDGLELYWQIQGHIAESPFYYIEYGLAQVGALLVWANARQDQAGAVAAYRRALSAGNTLTLPQLYEAAGVRLSFDADTLRRLVALIEQVLGELHAGEQSAI